jgi:hypothetical protein
LSRRDLRHLISPIRKSWWRPSRQLNISRNLLLARGRGPADFRHFWLVPDWPAPFRRFSALFDRRQSCDFGSQRMSKGLNRHNRARSTGRPEKEILIFLVRVSQIRVKAAILRKYH